MSNMVPTPSSEDAARALVIRLKSEQSEVQSKFVACYNTDGVLQQIDSANKFIESCEHIFEYCVKVFPSLEILEKQLGYRAGMDMVKAHLTGCIMANLPQNYGLVLEAYYEEVFKAFCALQCPSSFLVVSHLKCSVHPTDRVCIHKTIITSVYFTARVLGEVQMFEPLIGDSLTIVMKRRIKGHIESAYKKNSYKKGCLFSVLQWIRTHIMPFLEKLYTVAPLHTKKRADCVRDSLMNFQKHLLYFAKETVGKLLTDRIFNVVVDYPETEGMVLDLKMCMEQCNMEKDLATKAKEVFEFRLLHVGVSTPDILTAYISAIRVFQKIDPSFLLLDAVTEPIRTYLKANREDTVHCIVTNLTEEGSRDLREELGATKGSEKDYDSDLEDWKPEPTQIISGVPDRETKDSNVVTTLISLFGSEHLFIDEYRKLLADRFLNHFIHDINKEIRVLELLKCRFGDSELHKCEIMIKDLMDSTKIRGFLLDDFPEMKNMSIETVVIIMSNEFWPPFKENRLKVPEEIENNLQIYAGAYSKYKVDRNLIWMSHLGVVELDLIFGSKSYSYRVSPVHATIIYHFQTKKKWNLRDLSCEIFVPTAALRRKIGFWKSKGVITELEPDSYELCSNGPTLKEETREEGNSCFMYEEEEEGESHLASAQDQREEELKVFWSYVRGMLTNLESLPLERIYQMLKMFTAQNTETKEVTMERVKSFLEKKVRNGELIFSAGKYKLSE